VTWDLSDIHKPDFDPSPVPTAVLAILRERINLWNTRPKKWRKAAENLQQCLEVRVGKYGPQWPDGLDHRCSYCKKNGKLCVVMLKGDQVKLLPHIDRVPRDMRLEGCWLAKG